MEKNLLKSHEICQIKCALVSMIVGTNFLGHNSNNFQFEKKYPVDIAEICHEKAVEISDRLNFHL